MSGKGGVGKSTVAVNTATSLHKMGYRVGLLDCDITGPNVPKMMGLELSVPQTKDKMYPVPWCEENTITKNPLKVFSVAFLLPTQDTPVLKRGDFKTRIIADSLSKIGWGKLDYLVLDTPPGTSDEILTVLEYLKEMKLLKKSFALIVTQPSEISQLDVIKAISMTKQHGIKKAGILVNMTGMFEGDVTPIADRYKIPIVGKMSFNKGVMKCSDLGIPFVTMDVMQKFNIIIKRIIKLL